MPSLKEATEKIKAEKVKERDAGVDMYLEMFSDQNTYELICEQKDPQKRFRVIIQNLFQCVVLEKEQCLKKGGIENAMPASLKRLKAAAHVVRIMMETGSRFYEKEVVKMSVAHLVQMINHKSEVFKPIYSDYIKSIKGILLHTPHVQFLDPEQWQALATLFFNIVSGKKLKETIMDLPPDFWEPSDIREDQGTSSPNKARKTTTTLEVVDSMECLALLMRSDQAPLITPFRLGVFSLAKYLTFFQDFTGESSAHLFALTGLNHLLAQLEFNEREIVRAFAIQVWSSLLQLWNTRKEALKEQIVITFRILAPALAYPTPYREGTPEEKAELELAPSRAAQLAELQELILEEGNSRSGCQTLTLSSFDFAPPQFQDQSRPPPFSYRSFRGGRVLPATQALSWACLELGADVTAHLIKLSTIASAVAQTQTSRIATTSSRNGVGKPSSNPTQIPATGSKKRTASVSLNPETQSTSTASGLDSSRPPKKRRVDSESQLSEGGLPAALISILSRLSPEARSLNPSVSIWSLQVVLFLVERHWSVMTPALRSVIVGLLEKLVLDEVSEVSSYAYVAVAAIAKAHEGPNDFEGTLSSTWERIWNVSIRKHISGSSSRAAAHAALAILLRDLIPREMALGDLQTFLSSIDVTGPPYPHDSVCSFLGECVQKLSRDAVYSSSKLEEHVLLWLSLSWSPLEGTAKGFSSSRTRIETSDPTDIIFLLVQICRLPRLPQLQRAAILLPTCDVVSRVVSEHESIPLRNFFWEAKVDRVSSSQQSRSYVTPVSLERQVESRTMENIERRCSALLEKGLEDFLFRWNGGQNHSLTQKEAEDLVRTCSAEQARLSLEMVSMTVLWNAILNFNYIRSDSRETDLNALASQLLGCLSPVLAQTRWSASSRAVILKGIEPLLCSQHQSEASLIPDNALCEPGLCSGVPTSALPSSPEDREQVKREEREQREVILRLVWKIPEMESVVAQLLQAAASSLNFVSAGSLENDDQTEAMDLDDDGFGAVRSSVSTRMSSHQEPRLRDLSLESRAVATSVNLCISILVDVPRLSRGIEGAQSCDEVIQIVLQQDVHVLETVGASLLQAVAESRLHLTQIDASAILDVLGNQMLVAHSYGRSDVAQLLTISFVESTMNAWLHASSQGSDFADNIENVLKYLAENVVRKNARMSWRVRLRACHFFLRYLEMDPSESFWCPAERDPISSHTPSSVILSRNGDPDMRCRFSAASLSARLAETTQERGVDLETLHFSIDSVISTRDGLSFERIVTKILALGNSVVSNSATRHEALKSLIAIPMDYDGNDVTLPSLYDSYVRSILLGAALRLGYDDVPMMIYQFALVIGFEFSQGEDTLLHLPYSSLGFASKKDGMRHLFKPLASVFFCADVQMKSVRTVLGIITQRSLGIQAVNPVSLFTQECIPLVVAQFACFCASDFLRQGPFDVQKSKKDWEVELAGISEKLRKHNFGVDLDELLPSVTDQIIVSILSFLTEQTFDTHMSILEHVTASESAPSVKAFKMMSERVRSKESRLFFHPPPLPSFLAPSICAALKLLESGGLSIFSESTAYHVVRRMFSLISSTRQLNEQVRHLESLKLYLSMCSKSVKKNRVLLSIVLREGTALLGQVDLADFAWGLVGWCLDSTRELDGPLPSLGASLLQIIQRSLMYQNSQRDVKKELGHALENRLVSSLKALLEDEGPRPAVTSSLRVWPKEVPADLVDLVGDPDLEELTAALQSIGSAKLSAAVLSRFRGALRDLSSDKRQGFSRDIIWRLLNRLPDKTSGGDDQLQGNAGLASVLTDLFYLCEGHLRAPDVQTLRLIWDKAENRPEVSLKGAQSEQAGQIKNFLLRCLLQTEARQDLVDSERTFRCLRAVLGHDPQLSKGRFWPKGMTEELRMLSSFSSLLTPAKLRSPQTLERQESVEQAHSFQNWICFFACYLCDLLANLTFSAEDEDGTIYAQFSPLVESEPNLGKQLCPSILHALLLEDSTAELATFSGMISNYFTRVLNNPHADPQVWAAIIEAILHLRNYLPPKGPHATVPLGPNKWLELDFLLLARRALDCRQYTTALLFVELCNEHDPNSFAQKASQVSGLLYEAYSNVDDPDGFYGIQNSDLRGSLLQRLHHEGEWSKAFELHASSFESATAVSSDATSSTSSGLVNRSLHELGFNRLAATLGDAKAGASIAFDVAWRTGSWDSIASSDFQPGTSQGLFSALRSLHRELDQKAADKEISRALVSELDGLHGLGIEASAAVRRVSSDLMCLNEARVWREKVVDLKSAGEAISSFRPFWPALSEDFEFRNFERLLMVRQSILHSERQRHELDQIGDMADPITIEATRLERSLLLKLSSGARNQGRLQNSINAITLAQRLDDHLGSNSDSHLVTEEFANVLWEQGHHAIAIQALSSLESHLSSPTQTQPTSDQTDRMPAVLATLGQWHATARSQPPRKIDLEFFSKAHSMLSKDSDHAARAHVCYRYAIFADEQYQSLCNLPEISQLHFFISQREREVLEHQRLGSRSANPHLKAAKDALATDRRKVADHENAKQLFLNQSTKMYAEALQHSDRYDDKVIRFVALWFENSENQELNDLLVEILDKIPSYKLLILTHQLSSRLSSGNGSTLSGVPSPSSKFQSNLGKLMLRMCEEHPFHLLFTIYALKNGASSSDSIASPSLVSASDRAAAALSLWNKAMARKSLQNKVKAVEMVCDASVEWAKVPVGGELTASSNKVDGKYVWTGYGLLLERLVNIEVPVLTSTVQVNPAGTYVEGRDYTGIQKYQAGFEVAGGVHRPKISVCVGMDGKSYKQLFKSEDDLRQDAVFQQVFRLVNDLLRKDRRACQRLLKIRTYTVMPLGPQEGLLEFVGNTQAISEPLAEIHYLHQPGIDIKRFRGQLAAWDREKGPRKLNCYREICAQMPPAFRHYFWKIQKLPSAWFAMRLNYTRSVATTSIVGHLLGLGDRHVSNILLDNSTGEVVHIDFGVAFDQGKLLPIPEKVPFRLTRDLVDGMGISGVEGTFRRSCEETLRVLRESKDIIQTVLDVLKYDPLFTWTSNPVQLNQIQSTDAGTSRGSGGKGRKSVEPKATEAGQQLQGTAEIIAEQAINTIMSKLSPTLRIESTVNELIEQARDEENLGVIFSGWQAYF